MLRLYSLLPIPHSPMLTKQIGIKISTEEIKFCPGQPVSFDLTAINYSDRLSSFWLEITAAGVEPTNYPNWYQVSPGISTLNPPGDRTKFEVTIIESPITGFVGQINLTVKIFSLELSTEERQVIRLIIERDENANAIELDILDSQLSFLPGSRIEIPFRIFNSSQKTLTVTLSLLGLNPHWFNGKTEQTIDLLPEQRLEKSFQGQLPALTTLLAQNYLFKIVTLQSNTAKLSVPGRLIILPQGTVMVECDRPQQQIPAKRSWLPHRSSTLTNYQVQFTNNSNLEHQVSLDISQLETSDCQLELIPPQQELNLGETIPIKLVAQTTRPWWGWQRQLDLPIVATLADSRIAIENDKLNLTLKVHPILPTWLQGLTGLFVLGISWWLWISLFRLPPHQEKINAIDVNGLADRVVSVSNDRTIRTWEVRKFRPRSSKILGSTAKSIRSISYQPVNNNRVAIGLQNGEVQLWDLLSQPKEPLLSLSDNRADRVLDLEFTPDSRYLFSGHGSGIILQWDLGTTIAKPVNTKQISPPSAIYGLEIIGQAQNTLAIAGQYNDLMLWNWQQDKLSTLNYRPGGKDDYITSLATAEQQPFLLATGDNQGAISIWNLQPCLTGTNPCQLVDFWQDGHGEKPIRSVSLSPDGCYLSSSGDDGKLKLWNLDATHKRQPKQIDGEIITKLKPKLNSIDIKRINSQLQITTGGEDGKVRVYRQQVDDSSCSS